MLARDSVPCQEPPVSDRWGWATADGVRRRYTPDRVRREQGNGFDSEDVPPPCWRGTPSRVRSFRSLTAEAGRRRMESEEDTHRTESVASRVMVLTAKTYPLCWRGTLSRVGRSRSLTAGAGRRRTEFWQDPHPPGRTRAGKLNQPPSSKTLESHLRLIRLSTTLTSENISQPVKSLSLYFLGRLGSADTVALTFSFISP